MRLPDLDGYQIEQLMGEDPFGWNFLAGNGSESNGKRLIRVLKSQSTRDQQISNAYQTIADAAPSRGVSEVAQFTRRMVGMPSAVSVPFPGWRGQRGNWRLSSLDYLSSLMPREESLSAIENIIHTVGQLHRQRIFHGGIRSDNVFLTGQDEPQVELIGFGEMVAPGLLFLESQKLPFFLAPEQLISRNGSRPELARLDVYSVGVVAYELLTKRLPRLDRLYQQYLGDPVKMDRMVLVSRGQLTQSAEQLYRLLQSEKKISWPDQPSSDREKHIRDTIEQCLAFAPSDRFANLTEASQFLRAEPSHSTAAATIPVHSDPVTTESDLLLDMGESQPPAEVEQPVVEEPPTSETSKVPTELPPSTQTEATPTKKKKAEKNHFGSVGEIFDDVPDDEKSPYNALGVFEKIPFVRRFKSSAVSDKLVALLLVAALVGLAVLAATYQQKLASSQRKSAETLSSYEANIIKQADSYRLALAEREKSAKAMADNMNATQDAKSQLQDEAQTARSVVRRTQENADQFFRLILENRDSDVPGFRESRLAALAQGQKFYQELVNLYGESPDFIVSTANAYFYLGRIYKEFGQFDQAVGAFVEAEQRYEALMRDQRNATFTRNLATASRELGELAQRQGRYQEASQLYDASSQYWEGLSQIDPASKLDSFVSINHNSLKIAECANAIGQSAAALNRTAEVASAFLDLQENVPNVDIVVGGVAESFGLLGELYESQGLGDKALSAYQQASDNYAAAIQLNSSVDRYHLGLGHCLARTGLLKNDVTKLRGAADVLGQVIARNPYEPSFIKTLADVYGVLAKNQRDGGKVTNAKELEESAIALLKPIIINNQTVPANVQHAYAERLLHLGELRMDGSQFTDSRTALKEAIAILTQLNSTDSSAGQYRRSLAEACGLAGYASAKLGDKSQAKDFYNQAKSHWKTYLNANPNDTDASKRSRWTSDQLRVL